MLGRWSKMWLPFDKRMTVSAIQLPDKSLVEDPVRKLEVLADHWKPVFAKKAIDVPLANLIAQKQSEIDMFDTQKP